MAQIEVFYKIYIGNEEIKEKKTYYYMNIDFKEKLTKKDIEEYIIADGYNYNYIDLLKNSTYEYGIIKINQNPPPNEPENLTKLENDNTIDFKKEENEVNYRLYLHIIINKDEYEKISKETISKENEENESKEIKEQFSNVEQIANELKEIKKQIYFIKQNSKNEQIEIMTSIKNNFNINTGGMNIGKKENSNEKLLNELSNYRIDKKDNNYNINGRDEELKQCYEKIQNMNKLCVYGAQGVGKKCFIKEFAQMQNNFDETYFLEINSIDKENPENKINILINGICECNTEKKNVLLIIYFNEVISIINNLKEFILKCETTKKNVINISYIFTFTLDDEKLKESRNDFKNHIELTHFRNYEKNQINLDSFINLFDFLKNKKNKLRNKDKLIDAVKKYFENLKKKLSEPEEKKTEEPNNEIKEEKPKNEIKDEKPNDKEKSNEKEDDNYKGTKINNIFLFASYIDIIKDDPKIEEKMEKLFEKDDKEIKKKIIHKMIEGKDNKLNEIFFFLTKLYSGISRASLKFMLTQLYQSKKEDATNESSQVEKMIDDIKEKLYGLIIVEKKGNEEIFIVDKSFKPIIEEVIKENKSDIKLILKTYFLIIRNLLKKYECDSGFHACIKNRFWNPYDDKLNNTDELNKLCINEIDRYNIYHIIKNIEIINYKDNPDILKYIGDISISLLTLLYFDDKFYSEYLIIQFFELFEHRIKIEINKKEEKNKKEEENKKDENNKKDEENKKAEENKKEINKLLLRLGLFKYWISKNHDLYQKSLKLAEVHEQNSYFNDDDDTKFEYYLSQIYDCMIIKKDNNLEYYYQQCKKILEKNKDEYNKERLEKFYKDAKGKIDKDPRNQFYFVLEDSLESNNKTNLNNNFYLTQKLLTIIPSNFGIKFKTFGKEEISFDNINFFQEKDGLININFLYLEKREFIEPFLNFFGKEENKDKIGIKILVLGDLESNNDNLIKKLKEKGVKNIIYFCKDKDISLDKDNKERYYYYLERYLIEFIHDFVSKITSKYNYCLIKEAFDKAKRNFVSKFTKLFESANIKTQIKVDELIKIESLIEDDTFEVEYLDEEGNFDSQKKIIDDICDEYEYEYNKIKNIYYRPNPFAEGNERHLKKRTYRKYMKLPGFETLKPQNFLDFIEKDIYVENNKPIKTIIENIENNNIVNIYGNVLTYELGDELCKYFYMVNKFEDGIYIISPKNIEEELNTLKSKIKLGNNNTDNKNKILILLKLLDNNYKDKINKDKIISLISELNAKIVLCFEGEITENEKEKETYKGKNIVFISLKGEKDLFSTKNSSFHFD